MSPTFRVPMRPDEYIPERMMKMKAYKLFRINRTKKGKLYPLFVDGNTEIPIGEWMEAKCGEMVEGTEKVKSKLGPLAFRPGWHLSDMPLAVHIGIKGESGKIEMMNQNHIWCECEYEDTVNYQPEANENGMLNGKFVPKKAYLKKIPVHGSYRYKTSPNMLGEWIIAGNMRIIRVLTDTQVAEILHDMGYEPMPRENGELDFKELGFGEYIH